MLDEERRVAASVAQRPVPAHDLERKDVGRRARASHRLLGRGDRHLRGCRRTWHRSEVLEADPLGDIIWGLLQDVGDDSQQLGSVLAVQQPVFDLCTPSSGSADCTGEGGRAGARVRRKKMYGSI